MSVFSKLLGLEGDCDSDDCIYYLNCIRFFNEKYDYFFVNFKFFQRSGTQIQHNSGEKVFVDSVVSLELIDMLFMKQVEEKEYQKLKEYVKEFEIFDSNSQNNQIEFDLLMLKILEVYSIQKEETRKHLKYIFYAADVKYFNQSFKQI